MGVVAEMAVEIFLAAAVEAVSAVVCSHLSLPIAVAAATIMAVVDQQRPVGRSSSWLCSDRLYPGWYSMPSPSYHLRWVLDPVLMPSASRATGELPSWPLAMASLL
jgi:hypothetical protein